MERRAAEHATIQIKEHTVHTGHEQMSRERFWICFMLSFPILLNTPMLQMPLGIHLPEFSFNQMEASLACIRVIREIRG